MTFFHLFCCLLVVYSRFLCLYVSVSLFLSFFFCGLCFFCYLCNAILRGVLLNEFLTYKNMGKSYTASS